MWVTIRFFLTKAGISALGKAFIYLCSFEINEYNLNFDGKLPLSF